MADVSKIRLPDSTVVNLKDYRIPGVDTEPTSGSSNIVTSGGVYQMIVDDEQVTSAALNDLNNRVISLEAGGGIAYYTNEEVDTILIENW